MATKIPRLPFAVPDIPGFRLLHRVGFGASGEVWIARNEVDKSVSALKIVRCTGPDRRLWLRQELKAVKNFAALVDRPDCLIDVRYVAKSPNNEFLFYTMPPSDGVGGESPVSGKYRPLTLGERLRREKYLGLRESAEIAARVVRALQALHSNKLLHRDVKPDNIIFRSGKAVLADIGLVTVDRTQVSFAGTPKYMEPGVCPSELTDLYAAGKVLYQMISGKDAADFPDCGSRKDNKDIRLYPVLNRICLRACGDRKNRYRNAAEMLRDLESAVSGSDADSGRVSAGTKSSADRLTAGAAPRWTELLGPGDFEWDGCPGHLFKLVCPFIFVKGAARLNNIDLAKSRVAVFLPKAYCEDTPMLYVIADTWTDFSDNENLTSTVLRSGFGMVALDTPLTGICRIDRDADVGDDGVDDDNYQDAVEKVMERCGSSSINESFVLASMRFTSRNLWLVSRFIARRFGIRSHATAVLGTGFGVHAAGYAFNESGFGDALLGVSGIPESDDHTVQRMLTMKEWALRNLPWSSSTADAKAARAMNPATYAGRVKPPRTIHLLFGDDDPCFSPEEVYDSMDCYKALRGRDSESFLFREENRRFWPEALKRILGRDKGVVWYEGDDDFSDWRGDLKLQFIKTRLQLLKLKRQRITKSDAE